LIADDHPGWIEGVRSIIHKAPDMHVVGEVEDGAQIKQKVGELKPDILLLDLIMPNHKPAEFEKWVREHYPEIVTLVLTAHHRDAYLAGMMEAGVAGYSVLHESAYLAVSTARFAPESADYAGFS
jgi:DNA-binding NarL/FixJ family response regulator